MAKRQRLTLQEVLNEIFMHPLSEDDKEDHLEKDSPELDEEVLNELTDTCNKPVRSSSDYSFGFHRTSHAGPFVSLGHSLEIITLKQVGAKINNSLGFFLFFVCLFFCEVTVISLFCLLD